MITTKTALELTKRYAASASCEIDLENIENTMFYPHYKDLARGTGKIGWTVVRKYWFQIHNTIVIKLFLRGKSALEQANKCLIHAGIVKKILEERLIVAYIPLCLKDEKLSLSMGETLGEIDKNSLKVEEESIISFHGKAAAEIITKDEAAFLTNKTRETIDLLNRGGK